MVIIRTSLFINCSTGLDHKTVKEKYIYGICVGICSNFSLKCEASRNNIVKVDFSCSKSWYGARRDCKKKINNAFILETVSSDKKKKHM